MERNATKAAFSSNATEYSDSGELLPALDRQRHPPCSRAPRRSLGHISAQRADRDLFFQYSE